MRLLAALVLAAGAAIPSPARGSPGDLAVEPVTAIVTHFSGLRLDAPMAVFFDPAGAELYVADSRNDLVAIFDRGGIPRFSFGREAGVLRPRWLVADAEGRIYVNGAQHGGVQVFSFRGEPLGPFPFHDRDGPAEVRPTAMAVSPDGHLLFADQRGKRILVFDADWSFVRAFGHGGRGSGTLATPMGIAVGPGGEIFVSDRSGIPIQVFSEDGRFLRSWGAHDLGNQNFSAPAGLAVDGRGRVWVADTLRQDVKVFDREGRFLFHFGGLGTGPGQLAYPVDVAFAAPDRIYVCEKVGRRVQIFRILEGLASPVDPGSEARP